MEAFSRRQVLGGIAAAASIGVIGGSCDMANNGVSGANFQAMQAELDTTIGWYEAEWLILERDIAVRDALAPMSSEEDLLAVEDSLGIDKRLSAVRQIASEIALRLAGIFESVPVNQTEADAVMRAIELYESRWAELTVLRNAPRAFFTPPVYRNVSLRWRPRIMPLERSSCLAASSTEANAPA